MDARTLIMQADGIVRRKGMTQSEWSAKAGHAKNGQTVSRIISKGDCRMSTFLRLLRAVDCRLEIVEENDADDTADRL